MESDRPILIATASAGAGHNIAAQALEHAFRTARPAQPVEVVDILRYSNLVFRKSVADGYLFLANHTPSLFGALYDFTDDPRSRISDAVRSWLQEMNVSPFVRMLRRRRPRLIVNTHFMPAEVVAQQRVRGALDAPQMTVITDLEIHRFWVQRPTERYFTGTELARAFLVHQGVPPDTVFPTGIPIRPGFMQPAAAEALRRQHELPVARPVILLLSGGFGIGPTQLLLRELLRVQQDATIVVIAGRNETLRARLERVAAAESAGPQGKPRGVVRVLGFTDKMHEWMRAADLVVSKPGGLTVSESLACGVPLVIMNAIPGQEARNSDYLLEHGAAIKVNHIDLLGYRVRELLDDPPRLAALRENARRLGRPDAATRIVQEGLALLDGIFDGSRSGSPR